MNVLLDTHVLLWAMTDSRRLSASARRSIEGARTVFVSAVSLWEIALKSGLGKLEVDLDGLHDRIADAGFEELPVRWAHAVRLRRLPDLHKDPFDRMLVAQALGEPARLLTHDATLAAYSELVDVV